VEAGRPGRQGPRYGGEGGGAKQTHHAGRVGGIRHRSVILAFRSSKISQGYGNFFSLKYIFEEQINAGGCSIEKYKLASRQQYFIHCQACSETRAEGMLSRPKGEQSTASFSPLHNRRYPTAWIRYFFPLIEIRNFVYSC
jgi:hypothetical protein